MKITKVKDALLEDAKTAEKLLDDTTTVIEEMYSVNNVKDFSISEFIKCLNLVGQRTLSNYVKNYSGYNHDIQDMSITYSNLVMKLLVNPEETAKIVNLNFNYFQQQAQLWSKIFFDIKGGKNDILIEPKKGDKRFIDEEWTKNPFFNFIKQNYLLTEKLSEQIVDEIEVDHKIRRKLDFYAGQYLDAFSPTNFPFTNPEVLKLTIETKGKCLWDGLNNLVKDLEKGKISQSDESAFEVGKDLAITPGFVVYENELIQLIQYTPVTKNVFEIPLLIIPPWINKYYVLDRRPENSFVKFMVEQGFTVFIISWRNPKPGMGYLTFDDYVEKGALKAIEVAQNISGSKKINTLGYCLGGTLLGIASAILSESKQDNPINSATFLAAMIDFSYIGPMGDVINGALVKKLERRELLEDGVLHGKDMETAFNLIRDKDLIWNYVINNYLKGEKPSAFDIIYWTNDNANLPADMYIYYMRNIIFENKLSRKNALHICNKPIDIGKIDVPVIVIGLKDDYISPAVTVFTTTELVKGQTEFILGESGHVMGAVNPPSKMKYGYYMGGKLGNGFEEWKKSAKRVDGSWWTLWVDRLSNLSGKNIAATVKAGNENYKVIESAPGRYVKEKA